MQYTHLAREHLRSLVKQDPKREELRDLAQTTQSPERRWDARGLRNHFYSRPMLLIPSSL